MFEEQVAELNGKKRKRSYTVAEVQKYSVSADQPYTP